MLDKFDNITLAYNNTLIEKVSEFKYIVVKFDNTTSFTANYLQLMFQRELLSFDTLNTSCLTLLFCNVIVIYSCMLISNMLSTLLMLS